MSDFFENAMLGLSQILGGFSVGSQIANNRRNLEYAERMQNEIFRREDNAMQRRVADVTAAGFSPMTALDVGGSGVGQIVNNAPYSPVDFSLPAQTFQQTANSIAARRAQRAQEDYQKGQLDVAEFNAVTQRLQHLEQVQQNIRELKQSDDHFLREMAIETEKLLYENMNQYLNRMNQKDIAQLQADTQLEVQKMNREAQEALENLRHRNSLESQDDMQSFEKDLQLLLQDNQIKESKYEALLQYNLGMLRAVTDRDKFDLEERMAEANIVLNSIKSLLDVLPVL